MAVFTFFEKELGRQIKRIVGVTPGQFRTPARIA
jgi:hypothetical protein